MLPSSFTGPASDGSLMTVRTDGGEVSFADASALAALAYRYASAVDRRDREMLLSVFHPDAILRVIRRGTDGEERISTRTGHREVGEITELISRYDRTFHFVGNHRYEVSGDQATGEVYCMARHLALDDRGSTDVVMFIRYHDLYRRGADGSWLVAERDVQVDWSEEHVGVSPWTTNPSNSR
jgi:ketosteroid isomerase-like protein